MKGGQVKRCWSFPGYVTFCMTQAENSMNRLDETMPEPDMQSHSFRACLAHQFEAWPDTDEETDLGLDMASDTDSSLNLWQKPGPDRAGRIMQDSMLSQTGKPGTDRVHEIMQDVGHFRDAQRRVVSLEAALQDQQQQQQQQSPASLPMSGVPPTVMLAPVTALVFLPSQVCSRRETSANVQVLDINKLHTTPVISSFSGSSLSTTPQSRTPVPGSQRVLPIGARANLTSEDSDSDSTLACDGSTSFGSTSAHSSCDSSNAKPPGPLPVGLCSQLPLDYGRNRVIQVTGDIQVQHAKVTEALSLRKAWGMLPEQGSHRVTQIAGNIQLQKAKTADTVSSRKSQAMLPEHGRKQLTEITGDLRVQQTKTTEAVSPGKSRAMLPAVSSDISAQAVEPAWKTIHASRRPALAYNKETTRRPAPVLLGANSNQNPQQCPPKSIMPVGLIRRA